VRLAWCFGFSAGWGSGSCLGAWSCVLVSVLGDFACWPVLAGGGFVLVSFSAMEISFICVKFFFLNVNISQSMRSTFAKLFEHVLVVV
jgi:hypothetical protein